MTTYTLTAEQLLDLSYQVAGVASACFLVRAPDIDFAEVAEEVKAAVVKTIAEFRYEDVTAT